jgi:ubiquinone/menaquinone biosynthesis C-methylase UbiE
MIYQPERILLRKWIIKNAPKIPEKTLDVGGGDGCRYRSLFDTNDFTTIDIDPTNYPDVVAAALVLPFTSETFDTILCSQVLEHIMDPLLCLQEINRALKPDGRLYLTVPFLNEVHSAPQDYLRFTEYGLVELLNSTKFKIETLEPGGRFATVVVQFFTGFFILKYDLYSRNLLQKFFGLLTRVYSSLAIWIDSEMDNKWAKYYNLGYNVVAVKEQ